MIKNNLILEDKVKAEDFENRERTNMKKRQRKLVHAHLKFRAFSRCAIVP